MGACLTGHGQVAIPFTFSGLDVAIPDGDSLGVANTHLISSSYAQIESLRLSLRLEGGQAAERSTGICTCHSRMRAALPCCWRGRDGGATTSLVMETMALT